MPLPDGTRLRARPVPETGGSRRNDDHFLGTAKQTQRLFIQFDDDIVVAADDQQGRRLDDVQTGTGQVGTAPARNHRPDGIGMAGGRHQRGRGTRAGAKAAQAECAGLRLRTQPIRGTRQAIRQERDVKNLLPVLSLPLFEQIHQKRRQASFLKHTGHELVTWAEAAAAAAVGEQYHGRCLRWHMQYAAQAPAAGKDFDKSFLRFIVIAMTCTPCFTRATAKRIPISVSKRQAQTLIVGGGE